MARPAEPQRYEVINFPGGHDPTRQALMEVDHQTAEQWTEAQYAQARRSYEPDMTDDHLRAELDELIRNGHVRRLESPEEGIRPSERFIG